MGIDCHPELVSGSQTVRDSELAYAPQNDKLGFTLAEVLITLAIIGIVAVLTIPTLVANNQEKGWNTAATVFERKLEESLKVMNTQGTLAGYKTTEAFVNELQKHLKITKVCKNDDILSCFEDKVMFGAGEAEPEEVEISKVKTAKHFGQKNWGTNIVGLQLNNGTSALIAYNPECRQNPYSNQITGSDCVAILYDTSGFSKPNTSGKDLRAINVTKLGNNCAFEINGTCYGAPFFPTPITYAECEVKKGDLGLKACPEGSDDWMGAVAQCGHISKMPTSEQLDEIASYIYNTTVSPRGYTNATRDNEKVAALGFKYSASPFYVWAREDGSIYAYNRAFGSNNTSRYVYEHYGSYNQAVCIAD